LKRSSALRTRRRSDDKPTQRSKGREKAKPYELTLTAKALEKKRQSWPAWLHRAGNKRKRLPAKKRAEEV
jgi:hypothetical protein